MVTKLDRPVVIDLVALEEVEAAVDAAERELLDLEAQVATARATAERLEAQLRAEGADPDVAAWMVVRCRQFVQELVFEAEEEAQVVVAQARGIAALRTGKESPWLAGALAARVRRPSPEPAVRWRAPDLPTAPAVPVAAPFVPAPVAVVDEPLAPAPEVVTAEPVVAPVAEVAVTPGFDMLGEIDLTDPGIVAASPDGAAPQLERDFWPATRETAPFWKRRPKVTVATTLTVSAGLAAMAAVAVQLV